MSARAEKIATAKKVKIEQVVTGFDPEQLKAPFLLRCGALLIDYILLISIPVISILLGRMSGDDGARLLNNEISNAGWIITLLLALTNFFIFPVFNGQTIGKMLTGLQIARIDGSTPGFGSLILRHLVGYPVTFLTGGLGYIFSVFNKTGRSLHDFIGGTVVVYGQRKVNRKKTARLLKTKVTKKNKSRSKKKAQNA